jgi:Phage tail baseplate hub (GPD)
MSVTVQLSIGGQPAPNALYNAIAQLEVEESSDQPGALLLQLPANRTSVGDLQFIGDGTFEPQTNITLTVTPAASGSPAQCIFDGYVLSWRLHLDRASTSSTTEVWAQDASWLMNIDDQVAEWSGQTDGQVANAIFAKYGFTPADGNTLNDSPSHTPDGHTLFQRATDLQFLRGLARRDGKLCRVGCTDSPGARTGYFVTPAVDGQPVTTISLIDPASWTVDTLDFDWDVMRPTDVDAGQVDLTQSADSGTEVTTDSSGLKALGDRDYPTYRGQSSTLLLTAPADVPELSQRTAAVLAESGFFARCSGEADAERIGTILRVGDVVTIEGAGSLQSGNWLVWNVRHKYSLDSWRMNFTLVRNAMGPASAGGALASLASAAGPTTAASP